MPFEDIAKELGIQAAWSTLEHVFHDQHGLFRHKATYKPFLSPQHIDSRLAFCHMALNIVIREIVFTDEMWIQFNSVRRQQNVTRKRGVDPHQWAIHKKQNHNTIRVMFWGAICLNDRGPYHIWEKETHEDERHYQEIVAHENQVQQERQEHNQAQAAIPGTWQSRALEEINSNIERQNVEEERQGRHKRRRRGPHQEFKEEQLKFQRKGGINWVAYRTRVLEPLLYPWINELQASTGMPVTYLVEENAPAHQTVQRIDAEERTKRGIITFKWPSNSPDLNQIEPVWCDQKDEIATFQFTGASQETVEAAKAVLVQTWNEYPQELINRRCATFYEKLERCILHGGNNNYNG